MGVVLSTSQGKFSDDLPLATDGRPVGPTMYVFLDLYVHDNAPFGELGNYEFISLRVRPPQAREAQRAPTQIALWFLSANQCMVTFIRPSSTPPKGVGTSKPKALHEAEP